MSATDSGGAPEDRAVDQVLRLVERADELTAEGLHDQAQALYDEIVTRFRGDPDAVVIEQVVGALLNKGAFLGSESDHDGALAVFDDALAVLHDGEDARDKADWLVRKALHELECRTLYNKAMALLHLERHDEEIAAYDEVAAAYDRLLAVHPLPDETLDTFDRHVMPGLFNKALQLEAMDRPVETLAAYDDILTRYDRVAATVLVEDDDEGSMGEGSQQVAWALTYGINLLEIGGEPERALAACDEMVTRFATLPRLREHVARTVRHKAAILDRLGRHDDELAAYDWVVAHCGDNPDPELRDHVIAALQNKATVLDATGRHDDEVAVYDEIVRRCGDLWPAEPGEPVARALIDKAITLSHNFDRPDDAFALYDEVVARFGAADDPASCAAVVEAQLNRAELLDRQERADATLATYDDIVVRYDRLVAVRDEEPPADLRDRVAAALHNKGLLLKEHGQLDGALVVFDEALVRFGSDAYLGIRQVVASAHRGRGQVLDELERTDEAIAAFDDAIGIFDADEELTVRVQVYEALVNKAATLAGAERPGEAVALFDELGRRYDQLVRQIDAERSARAGGYGTDVDEVVVARVPELAATAVLNHAIALSMLDRIDEELATYDNLVAFYDHLADRWDDDELPPAVRRSAARALLYKGGTLEERGDEEAAAAAYESVLSRFTADPDEDVQDSVAEAEEGIGLNDHPA